MICVTFWTLVALAIHHYNALLNQRTFSSKTSSATTRKLRTRPFIIFQISQISIVLMVGQCFVARCSAVLSVEIFANSQTSLLQTGHNGLKIFKDAIVKVRMVKDGCHIWEGLKQSTTIFVGDRKKGEKPKTKQHSNVPCLQRGLDLEMWNMSLECTYPFSVHCLSSS